MPTLSTLPILLSIALALTSLHTPVLVSLALSVLAFYATRAAIPLCADVFIRAGQSGKDVGKKDKPVRAESMGLVAGAVYFIVMFVFIPVPFAEWFAVAIRDSWGGLEEGLGEGRPEFPLDKLASFLSGLLSLLSMLFLGFADDVFDIRWRIKIWFPLFASIPLLTVYYITYGVTDIKVPLPLRGVLGTDLLHLGILYYIYLLALPTFTTNAINILAGINGIEGGQSLVIALSLIANDVFQLSSTGNPAAVQAHLGSLFYLLPFVGVTGGYLWWNWYPATVFGGDTYAYFSGMIFSVVGILGHFSKTVLLFMLPQIFNFLYSCPQLFGFVEIPRHRMPRLDVKTGLMEASWACLDGSEGGKKLGRLGNLMLSILAFLRLVSLKTNAKGERTHVNNLTLINLLLVKFGPMSEERTTLAVMSVQVLGSAVAFVVRYVLVHLVY